MTPAEQILDRARWAPSPDNRQLWRYRLHDAHHFTLHALSENDPYDYERHASLIAFGALLRTVKIAAAALGYETRIQIETGNQVTADVTLEKTEAASPSLSSLAPFIESRSVNRFPLQPVPLTEMERVTLEKSVGPGYRILWFPSLAERLRIALFIFQSAKIRLSFPEFFAVHKQVIDWTSATSPDRIPGNAVGLDPLMRRISRWAMASWERFSFLGRYAGGTIVPRIEMDILPGIFCATHYMIVGDKKPETPGDWIAAGEAMQNFWLTAESLDLRAQPETTPLIFSRYAAGNTSPSADPRALLWARRLRQKLTAFLGERAGLDKAVWMGRLGHGRRRPSRSLRKPLSAFAAE